MRKKIHEPYEKAKRAFAGLGITYNHIGAIIGRTNTSVQFKINGESDFTISEIDKICKETGLPLDIFLP